MAWPPQIPRVGLTKLLIAILEAIIARIDAITPKDGIGNQVTDAVGGGKSINATTPVGGGGVVEANFPFQLLIAGTDIRVRYGTVNGEEPDGMSPGDDPVYVITPTGTSGYVYLILSTDVNYVMDSLSIDVGATVPTDTENTGSGGIYHFQLGSYSVDGSVITLAQSVSGSLGFQWCNGPKFAKV